MRKKKNPRNALLCVPQKNPVCGMIKSDSDLIVLTVPHCSFYDRIAQRFFHKPPVSYISLDAFGSFLWECIDGKRCLSELSEAMKAQFGEAAEPLLPRLLLFFRILSKNGLVYWRQHERIP